MSEKIINIPRLYDRIEMAASHFEFEKERIAKEIFELAGLESYYTKKHKQSGISMRSLSRVKYYFPELDLNWLLTGEGSITIQSPIQMVNEDPEPYSMDQRSRLTRIEEKIDKVLLKLGDKKPL